MKTIKKLFTSPSRILLLLIILLSVLSINAYGETPSVQDKEAFKAMLSQTLKENPDLVLDVLKDNSELVLEVAQMGSDLKRRKMLLAQWLTDLQIPKTAITEGRPTFGSDNAPVTIIAFTDFTCLYCQQGEQTIKSIAESYGKDVRIVYKMLPMSGHPGAIEAAQFMLAAYKQNPDKSWRLFNTFFNHRDEIIAKSSDTYLRAAALDLGFDMKRLLADAAGKDVKQMMQEDESDANRLGIKGTPYFLVNDIVVRGALEEPLFREAVDLALRAAKNKQ